MENTGQYIYCIVGTKQDTSFGTIGIDGDEVRTVGSDGLGMVVSRHPMTRFVVSRDNLLAHETVIEKAMKEFDSVLPVRFGTVANNADAIINFLDRRHGKFKSLLKDMDHKVELGVKGLWKNRDLIFEEIEKESRRIRGAKAKIKKSKGKAGIQAKVEVGKMVEEALQGKKEEEADKIVDALRRTALDCKLNKTINDEMFMNAAFLVDRGREKEFDNIMDDLSEQYKKRIRFMYAGPLPVFNSVNITIYPEEWEK